MEEQPRKPDHRPRRYSRKRRVKRDNPNRFRFTIHFAAPANEVRDFSGGEFPSPQRLLADFEAGKLPATWSAEDPDRVSHLIDGYNILCEMIQEKLDSLVATEVVPFGKPGEFGHLALMTITRIPPGQP